MRAPRAQPKRHQPRSAPERPGRRRRRRRGLAAGSAHAPTSDPCTPAGVDKGADGVGSSSRKFVRSHVRRGWSSGTIAWMDKSAGRLARAWLALEGLALGDAFGETFFVPDASQRVSTQKLAGGQWRWTDDTAMAIGIVETLAARGGIDQDELARRFAAGYVAEPWRGYGPAMHRALRDIHAGRHWRPISHGLFSGRGSYGNGAAMRAPVIGAWHADDLEDVVRAARLSAEVTHAHPEAAAGATAVALAAALACHREQGPAGASLIGAVRDRLPNSDVRRGVERALAVEPDSAIADAVHALGNGIQISCQDTVPLVLWCAAYHLHDYRRALWRTVSALGDRDTTCAMVGAIVACRVGHQGLPTDWLARREPLPRQDLSGTPVA
jgi:ADP-ribosylglycohydrolase